MPLFVEEVTRLLLERGEQSDIQAIPPTLQQSLMARLDRLGPAREIAQIGSGQPDATSPMRCCHRQWETDPPGTLNLTHRIRWFPP